MANYNKFYLIDNSDKIMPQNFENSDLEKLKDSDFIIFDFEHIFTYEQIYHNNIGPLHLVN